MASYLLFTLRGPMQSWGGASSVGEKRLSAQHPSHSAVVGLIAAALGIRRDQTEALDNLHQSLHLAVRQDRLSGILTDFHTVQSAKDMNKRFFYTRREEVKTKIGKLESLETTLSSRVYLTDAAFIVCLWKADANNVGNDYDLGALREALLAPRLTLYLGRKSCPVSCPLLPMIEEAPHIAEAFQLYVQHYNNHYRNDYDVQVEDLLSEEARAVWTDEGHGMDLETSIMSRVKDRVVCSERRQYGMRDEYYSVLTPFDAVENALDEVFHEGEMRYVHD